MSSHGKASPQPDAASEQLTAVERRRSQNRVAQKNYRHNIKNRLSSLEEINRSLVHDKIVAAIPNAPSAPSTPSIPGTNIVGRAPYHNLHIAKSSTMSPAQSFTANADNLEMWEEFDLGEIDQVLHVQNLSPEMNQEMVVQSSPTTNGRYSSSQFLERPRGNGSPSMNQQIGSSSTLTEDLLSIAQPTTALHLAVLKDHHLTASVLIDNGAAVGAIDEEGRTPLHVAAKAGSYACVQLLLRHGAEMEILDHKNMSVLKLAAMNGLVEVVTLLLEHGANVNL